jgi:hypothetical protein
MFITSNIVRSVTRSKDSRLRCISICRENEKYLHTLSNINCDIYILPHAGLSGWKTTVSEVPDNVFVLTKDLDKCNLPAFDFVMCHGRMQEFDLAHSLSSSLHIPIVTVDHVTTAVKQKLPMDSLANIHANNLAHRVGDINISISDKIKHSWNSSTHGISISIPSVINEKYTKGTTKKSRDFVIDNNIPNDFAGKIQNPIDKFGCALRFGPESEIDISSFKYYINTWNNIDNKTLEAMACGCVTISPKTDETETIIKHEENGLLFGDPLELDRIMSLCLEGKYDYISDASKQYTKDNHLNYEEHDKHCLCRR